MPVEHAENQMAPGKFQRLRLKIILSVSLLVVALIILSIWHSRTSYQTAISNAENQSQSYVRALKEHAERAFSEADHAIQNTIRFINARGGLNGCSSSELAKLVRQSGSNIPQIGSLTIIAPDGRMLVTSDQTTTPLPVVNDRAYFKHHLTDPSEALHVGEPIKSRLNDKWSFTLSRRITNPGGGFGGVVRVAFDLSYFEQLYTSVVRDRNGRVTLVSLAGNYLVLVPSDEQVYLSGKKTAAFFRKRVAEQPVATYHNPSSNLAKEYRIVSYHRLDSYPIVAITSFGKKEAIADWRKTTITQGVSVVLLSLLALLLTRMVLLQVQQLDCTNLLLSHKQDELQRAKEEAEAATRAKSEFLANMSHEVRTPVNAITNLTQLMLETELTAKQQDYLTKLKNSSGTLLGIVNDILDYSKIEARHLELEQIPLELDEVLNKVVDLFQAPLEAKRLVLIREIAPDVPRQLLGDPLRLGQVLNNLVGNAVKFTEQGEIRITVATVRQTADQVVLRFNVRDSGIGLSQEQAERLFQPFVQADGTIMRRFGGTGLGLSIAKSLVELMGGTITLTSAVNQGSVFSFTIPFGFSATVSTPSVTEAHAGTVYDIAKPIHGARILLVDDNDINRFVAREFLEKAGLQVTCASHGGEALQLLQQTDFDAVLMDMQMPEMDGIQATSQIRRLPGGSRIPIIAMTAAATEGDREFCLESGMDEHIAKPIVPQVMLEKLVPLVKNGRHA